MTPEEYILLRDSLVKIIQPLEQAIHNARELAEMCEPPEQRRPATPADVVVGAIIWHWRPEEYGGWYWHEIHEVHYPNDDFKAYSADDGCRYGLHEAWVKAASPYTLDPKEPIDPHTATEGKQRGNVGKTQT